MWLSGTKRFKRRLREVGLRARDASPYHDACGMAEMAYVLGYRDGIRAAGLHLEELSIRLVVENEILRELSDGLQTPVPRVEDILAVEKEVAAGAEGD